MRLRFTIRDLLWRTALVALAVAWWLEHCQLQQTQQTFADAERELSRVKSLRYIFPYGKIEIHPKPMEQSTRPAINTGF